ncbi:MAG: hypothetical protein IKB83_00080 [Mycoplasmataceae bacterium]|nr:hypothetical protein [bacterium]MBR2848893.1 hypothetical protein [Mycoplasmataceae bacterium]
MPIPEGLRTALNQIRETAIDNNTLYAQYIEEILPTTEIGSWASPILEVPKVMNEFVSELVQRIVYTQLEIRLFRNPLAILEGEEIPLGSIGEEIFINPIVGRRFNVDDFAGLLAKYEADVKVQYHKVNSDIQYPVTITRAKIKNAFTSWSELNSFIEGITNALYNGAYIDRYNMTKDLVASAYDGNNVQIEVVTQPTTEATGKAMVEKARAIFLNMQTPTDKYNAWAKVGGYGNSILTFTPKEDIVLLIRNDILATIDVNVLASSFNMDKTTFLGNVIGVNDFDVYESIKQDDGSIVRSKAYDGSKILGIMCDKRWFRIKQQDFEMDEFYNPNNRTWQYYLNDVRMYSYSLFANSVVFATEMPVVNATSVDFIGASTDSVGEGKKIRRFVKLTPVNATSTITFTSGTPAVVSVTKISNTEVEIAGVDANETPVTITASDGTHSDTISVTCTE